MATVAPITATRPFQDVFAAYSAGLALRDLARGDDEVERAEAAVEPLFNAVVSHPARDLAAIVSKCAAIVTEYPAGECPVDLVQHLLADLVALERHLSN